MTRPGDPLWADSRFPIRLSIVSLFLVAMMLIVLGTHTYQSYRVNQRIIEQELRLKELAGTIAHLDEVLTMSARMAAVTGDLSWEQRYRHFEPALNAVIKEAIRRAPETYSGEAAARTDQANIKLADMEHRSFDLVRRGLLAEAQALLFSDEYEVQKQIYARGMGEVTAQLKRRADTTLRDEQRKMLTSTVFVIAALSLLIVTYLASMWALRKWQRAILKSNRQLSQQAREINELNRTLDQRVTERTRDLELQGQQLTQANKRLRDMAALKDEFVAKVSHELRTPLTSIKEGLNLMLDEALGKTTDEQQDFLKTMDGDIDRLTELINNMLDISKIEAGRMRLVRSRLDLRTLIESLVRSYQPLIGHRNVQIEGTEAPRVFADSNRILQVFANLFSNAVKFTPDNGTITFHLESRNGMVAVGVRDTGPGISSEDLPKLFHKFSQVGRQADGPPRGTGLGLVVCKELTELHGGRVEVASEIGRGTTFTVQLPIYTDTLALTESFQELLASSESEEGRRGGVIAIQAERLLAEAGAVGAGRAVLERVTEAVRRHLHRGDIILPVDPSWVIVLAAADQTGLMAIVKRLREKLPESQRLQFGLAVFPDDGHTVDALFARASQTLDQGLASVQKMEGGSDG